MESFVNWRVIYAKTTCCQCFQYVCRIVAHATAAGCDGLTNQSFTKFTSISLNRLWLCIVTTSKHHPYGTKCKLKQTWSCSHSVLDFVSHRLSVLWAGKWGYRAHSRAAMAELEVLKVYLTWDNIKQHHKYWKYFLSYTQILLNCHHLPQAIGKCELKLLTCYSSRESKNNNDHSWIYTVMGM